MSHTDEISQTFLAALRSVGTACVMATAGIYIHRRGFITPEGKKVLARLSQQVTIPAFFFTKLVNCDQNFSTDPCPNVTERLRDCWILVLWPVFVVSCGILVGEGVARFSEVTSTGQRRSVWAACAFGNSTGLPITLLTVVHANFADGALGLVDPTLFLSVYLLLYPVLQWGIGGWLLGLDSNESSNMDNREGGKTIPVDSTSSRPNEIIAVKKDAGESSGCSSIDSGKETATSDGGEDYGQHLVFDDSDEELGNAGEQGESKMLMSSPLSSSLSSSSSTDMIDPVKAMERESTGLTACCSGPSFSREGETSPLLLQRGDDHSIQQDGHGHIIMETLKALSVVASKCLQPPVVASLLGIAVSSFDSIRGIFVDLDDRDGDATLEWAFDGLHAVGMAAVPVNMIILGINLSSAASKRTKKVLDDGSNTTDNLSSRTLMSIVVGKMIVQPIVGVISTVLFAKFIWEMPFDIGAAVYIVMMIVFITPTANNVMVMVELAGGPGVKESIAKAIGWQYAAAPFLLSFSVAAVVGVANALGRASER